MYNETLAHTMHHRKVSHVVVASPVGVRGVDDFPADAEGAVEVLYAALRGASEFIRSDSSIYDVLLRRNARCVNGPKNRKL